MDALTTVRAMQAADRRSDGADLNTPIGLLKVAVFLLERHGPNAKAVACRWAETDPRYNRVAELIVEAER
ncbi:MAG: hypothetical protein AB7O32_04910 [Vicinamibacterales bacterium]